MEPDVEARAKRKEQDAAAVSQPTTSADIEPQPRSNDKSNIPLPHLQVFAFLRWWLEDQWFLVALALLIVIASQAQVPESQQALKTTVVTYLCVSLIFLLTGLTLPTRTLLENYSRWKLHLFVQAQCFLMTSAVIFGIVSLCATNPSFMDPGLLIGLIFMGCVATTISSNVVMTRTAHGNVALTVVQSTLGNAISPFITPALVSMYTSTGAWYTDVLPKEEGGYGQIYRRVFKQLGLSIFLPLVSLTVVCCSSNQPLTSRVTGRWPDHPEHLP
jgi:sodium/bile acid cotransporter 7